MIASTASTAHPAALPTPAPTPALAGGSNIGAKGTSDDGGIDSGIDDWVAVTAVVGVALCLICVLIGALLARRRAVAQELSAYDRRMRAGASVGRVDNRRGVTNVAYDPWANDERGIAAAAAGTVPARIPADSSSSACRVTVNSHGIRKPETGAYVEPPLHTVGAGASYEVFSDDGSKQMALLRQLGPHGYVAPGGTVRLTLSGGGPDYIVPTERQSGVAAPITLLAEGSILYAVPLALDDGAIYEVPVPVSSTSLYGEANA